MPRTESFHCRLWPCMLCAYCVFEQMLCCAQSNMSFLTFSYKYAQCSWKYSKLQFGLFIHIIHIICMLWREVFMLVPWGKCLTFCLRAVISCSHLGSEAGRYCFSFNRIKSCVCDTLWDWEWLNFSEIHTRVFFMNLTFFFSFDLLANNILFHFLK